MPPLLSQYKYQKEDRFRTVNQFLASMKLAFRLLIFRLSTALYLIAKVLPVGVRLISVQTCSRNPRMPSCVCYRRTHELSCLRFN